MPGEFEFISWIRQQQAASKLLQVPAGDDFAVLKWPADDLLLVGVDQVLDGVHVDTSRHAPERIGQKVMNRNLSDCAAMACLPVAAVATVALPRGTGLDYAQRLYRGMADAAAAFNCVLAGGDTGSWDGKLAMTVTLLGRSDGIQPVTRAGAKPGDGIYVTGPLGGSILGRHLDFVPRIPEGRLLGSIATAMIDLSDGLSRDLRHICDASGVGATIEGDKIPIHDDARRLAEQDKIDPLTHALDDGEDYELLFTASVPPPIGTRVGTTTADGEIRLKTSAGTQPLSAGAWEHHF